MARTRNFADVIRAKLAADPELAAEVEAIHEEEAPFLEEIERLHIALATARAEAFREAIAVVRESFGIMPEFRERIVAELERRAGDAGA